MSAAADTLAALQAELDAERAARRAAEHRADVAEAYAQGQAHVLEALAPLLALLAGVARPVSNGSATGVAGVANAVAERGEGGSVESENTENTSNLQPSPTPPVAVARPVGNGSATGVAATATRNGDARQRVRSEKHNARRSVPREYVARARGLLARGEVPPEVLRLQRRWDEAAERAGLTPERGVTPERVADWLAALAGPYGSRLEELVDCAARSPICRGEGDTRTWPATEAWVLHGRSGGRPVAEALLTGAWALDADPAPEPAPPEEPGAHVQLDRPLTPEEPEPAPAPVEQQVLLEVQSPPPPTPADLQALWNRVAVPLGRPEWRSLSDSRARAAKSLLKACPDLARWEAFLRARLADDFYAGRTPRWDGADPDWLLRKSRADEVLDFTPGASRSTGSTRQIRAEDHSLNGITHVNQGGL